MPASAAAAPTPGRPDDRFGIGYFNFGFSDVLKDELSPVFKLRDQQGVEIFYNVAMTPSFRLSADLQFIKPGAGRFGDAVYARVSSNIRF